MVRQRKLGKSTVNNIFRFTSNKTDEDTADQYLIHTVESTNEYDACFHFEFSHHVEYFEAQPLGYEYELDGETHSYTPDFLLHLKDFTKLYVEVKPYQNCRKDKFRHEFEAKQVAAENLKIPLILFKTTEIKIEPFLSNIKFIRELTKAGVSNQYDHFIIKQTLNPIMISDLIIDGVDDLQKLTCVSSLIKSGKLDSDIDQHELCLNSKVWRVSL